MTDKKIIVPDILPAYEDGVFKALLSLPESNPMLRNIISSILMVPVWEAIVHDTTLAIWNINDHQEKLNINCKINNNEQIELELQSEAIEGGNSVNNHSIIKNRAVYNLSSLHSAQPGKGIRYDKLMRSLKVIFCGYTVFPERQQFVNRFTYKNEDGDELSDKAGIIFIELTKLGDILKKPVNEMTDLEIWASFFAVAHKPKYKKLLDEMIKVNDEIRIAGDLLLGISQDEIQRARFHSRRLYERDKENERLIIRDEARDERSIEIAMKLLMRGRPIEEIVEDTGLTCMEIERLRPTR